MKKKNIAVKWIALVVVCFAISLQINAQTAKNMYLNVDWQINIPIGNSFANKISGWGAHVEGGYFVTPHISIGGFFSFHSNNKYIDRQTIYITETPAITSDQQHSIFQIPFGVASRYTFMRDGVFEPYVGVQLGTSYSEVSSYMNILKIYERKWGFYAAPEVGVSIFPTPDKRFGFHIAAYYNYATNKTKLLGYSVDGLNNLGVRLGVAF